MFIYSYLFTDLDSSIASPGITTKHLGERSQENSFRQSWVFVRVLVLCATSVGSMFQCTIHHVIWLFYAWRGSRTVLTRRFPSGKSSFYNDHGRHIHTGREVYGQHIRTGCRSGNPLCLFVLSGAIEVSTTHCPAELQVWPHVPQK